MDGREFLGNETSVMDNHYYETSVRLHGSCTLSVDLPSVHGSTHYIREPEAPRSACEIYTDKHADTLTCYLDVSER